MAYIKKINFEHVDKNEGCLCDRCGAYIRNIISVEFTDGVKVNYGQDCFEKLYKNSKLNSAGVSLMKKTLKRIDHYTAKLESYVSGEINEENDEGYKTEQMFDGYWKGKPYEEYKDFMINEFLPKRFEECQKDVDRFSKVRFDR